MPVCLRVIEIDSCSFSDCKDMNSTEIQDSVLVHEEGRSLEQKDAAKHYLAVHMRIEACPVPEFAPSPPE